MKFSKLLLFGALLLLGSSLTAQSMQGSWLMEGQTEDGTAITNKISFNADGTLTVDFGNDGSIEVRAAYKQEGDKVTILAPAKEDPCHGTTGVYQVSIDGDVCTVNLVEDGCDMRRGDGKPGNMTRAN